MKKKNNKAKVVEKIFKIDPDFKDPLLPASYELFDEIEVEEADYYYKVHLGSPVDHKEK